MIKVTIDGIETEVEEGSTILRACEAAGKEIPRFCYHERLSIAGNCRMCLVEVEPSAKPVASCAMPVGQDMVIKTDSEMVRKAREGVMEFLLINHPLDCPICDQGGECDLQDQAMGYGMADSRYQENKRAVENKNMGPLIKTIMTRCIHCTRCVRFASEVAGVDDLGAIGRGEDMEITTWLEKSLASELSGNVVDLCPVGALTSKPYAFAARPWELSHTESIDVMDAVGSAIRIDSRGNQVMRVLPRINDDVNEEWISDKTRHAIDGLLHQRLDRPYMRRGGSGRLVEAGWDEVFAEIKKRISKAKPSEIGAIAGDQCDAESMYSLMKLMQDMKVANLDCRQDGSVVGGKGRGGYLFNSGITGIDEADVLLLLGCNPRHEAAVINARIRQRWLNSDLKVFRVGSAVDLTYPVVELGEDPSVIETLAEQGGAAATALKKAKNPMIILGAAALNRKDSKGILGAVARLAGKVNLIRDDWNGFNVLNTAAARVAGLDMGFIPAKGGMDALGMAGALKSGALKVLYNLGADEIDLSGRDKSSFVIYQGSHGDQGAAHADVVLPGAAWCEKDGIYVNIEGRVQRSHRAVFPVGDAREDWAIIRAVSAVLGKALPFNTHAELRRQMIDAVAAFGAFDTVVPARLDRCKESKRKITSAPLTCHIGTGSGRSFYGTCPISRSSVVMAECIAAFEPGQQSAGAK